MKLFKCQSCAQLLDFENTRCERCGHTLGYIPERATLTALEPEQDGIWKALGGDHGTFRFCANAADDGCNWMVAAESQDVYCRACRHNHIIPDLSDPISRQNWQKMERAKHRLFYSLLRLNLPLETRAENPEGLSFDFLAETTSQVMTGHEDGLITISLSEADDAEREQRRAAMHEPYRTLVGHFRHEVGHYFWDRLVRDGGPLAECRAVFGDDSVDYNASLQRHYQSGPPADWQDHFVSAYATTHPWEDFAETWAHYLHIIDTLEMARSVGFHVSPQLDKTGDLTADVDFDAYAAKSIEQIIDTWVPVSFAMNSINRCMGQSDLYPFVLSQAAITKLGFIHTLVHGLKATTTSDKMKEPPAQLDTAA